MKKKFKQAEFKWFKFLQTSGDTKFVYIPSVLIKHLEWDEKQPVIISLAKDGKGINIRSSKT